MRKILISIGLVFMCATLHAFSRASISSGTVPREPSMFTSDAVYYTTQTCSASNANNLIISTRSAAIYVVSVSSKGAGSPIITLYDARTTTGTTNSPHPGARQIYSPMNGLTERDYFLSVETSSGVALDIQGITPPCVTMMYYEK